MKQSSFSISPRKSIFTLNLNVVASIEVCSCPFSQWFLFLTHTLSICMVVSDCLVFKVSPFQFKNTMVAQNNTQEVKLYPGENH